jgi:hypothetical protein
MEQEPDFNSFVRATEPAEHLRDPPLEDGAYVQWAEPGELRALDGALEGTDQPLRRLQDLEGFAIRAADGTIGHVSDFYLDDRSWVIRYLVVETGSWLSSRKVLISPFSIGDPDWTGKVLPVSITMQQVRNSPDIDTDKPVSRQHETLYLGYYGYPYYWAGDGLWGQGAYPGGMLLGLGSGGSDAPYRHARAEDIRAESDVESQQTGAAHLRSCKELMRYHIEASDGGLGQVKGFLLDPRSWAIRFLIVDTSSWWIGTQVLIAPRQLVDISWADAMLTVGLTQQAVKDAPRYDAKVA